MLNTNIINQKIKKACADPEGGQGVRTPPPGKLQKYRVP